jgi:ABC-type bacteriocin/lantibiotic exporter with double-glycine peptidase domain
LAARRESPPGTPPLRQVQETECGVVALAIVLAHHGAWVPLPELRRRCQVSEHGVTAAALVQTGRHYGLAVRAMRLGADALGHVQPPVILFWEHRHFVVLEGIRGDTAWVNDPARGRRRLSLAALAKGYSGVALIAQPGPAFRPLGSPRKPVRTVVGMLRPGRWWLALIGAAVLAESVLLPVAVLLVGDAISDVRDGSTVAWRTFVLTLIGLLAAYVSQLRLTDIALGAITRPILHRLIDDLAHAPASFIQLREPAVLAGRLHLAEYPATTAVHVVTAAIRLAVAVPLLVLVLARIHPLAAFVALAALTVTFFMRQLPGREAVSHQGHIAEKLLREAGHDADIVSRGQWIDAFGADPALMPRTSVSRMAMTAAGAGTFTRLQRLVRWWPALRLYVELSPVIVVGVLGATEGNALPDMIVTLLATFFAFRLVDSAAMSMGMLYMLPESIVQLLDFSQQGDVAERAA